jgi:hypothetical protein
MLLEQQERLSVQHLIEHYQNSTALSIDHSCTICYPQPRVITVNFQNFWNWIENHYFGDSFTLYSVHALPTYCQAFRNEPNTNKSQAVINLAVKLLLSIRYSIRPSSFPDLLHLFLNVTYRTNYFEEPVTLELLNNLNRDLTLQVPILKHHNV